MDAIFPTSFLRTDIHFIGSSTSMRLICQKIAGFHKIESKIALAADGVMTS
jgi:hypothetical protein